MIGNSTVKWGLGAIMVGVFGVALTYIMQQVKKLVNTELSLIGTQVKKISLNEINIILWWRVLNDSDFSFQVSNQVYDVYLNETFIKKVGFSPKILLSILDNQSNMFKKNAGGIPLCSGVEIIKPSYDLIKFINSFIFSGEPCSASMSTPKIWTLKSRKLKTSTCAKSINSDVAKTNWWLIEVEELLPANARIFFI